MSASPAPGRATRAHRPFERWGDGLSDWCPYVTLAVSSVMALAWSTDATAERLVTAALVVLAALWVLPRATRERRNRARRTRSG